MLDLARLSLEFGYVLMFTVVWPLAPLAALLISALEQVRPRLRLRLWLRLRLRLRLRPRLRLRLRLGVRV